MKRILTVMAGLLAFTLSQGQELKKEVVYFDSDKAILKPSEKQKIDELLIALGDVSKLRFGLYGYTDNRGSIEYNLDLSQRRSQSVMDYLLSKGVNMDNVIIDHFGELSPADDNESNKGMAHNRRVEIRAFEIRPSNQPVARANPLGFREHPLVKPILPHLTKQREVFTIDANLGAELTTESGSVIKIPANAMVDANGNPVNGKVDISYREYHDPVEVLLSGIPMTFDSGGVVNQFQTAGMFEIEAVQNGTPVAVRKGEQIAIDLQSTDAESNYNFYALDNLDGWRNVGTAPANTVVNPVAGTFYPSSAYEYYMTGLAWRDKYLLEIDTSQFNKMFADMNYYYIHKADEVKNINAGYRYSSGKKDLRVRNRGYLKVKTMRKEKGDEKDVVRFTVLQITSPKSHPEMNAFKKTYWRFAVPMDRSEFRKTFSYKQKYNDIRVIYNEGEETAKIELKTEGGIRSFEVYPYQAGMGQATLAPESFAEEFTQYERLLNKRGKRFDKKVTRSNAKTMKMHKKQVEAFNKSVPGKRMTETEKAMKWEDWLAYNQEQMKEIAANANKLTANSYTLTRSLAMDGFGIYNCDQIFRLASPVEVIAQYNEKEKNAQLKWNTTYVLDENLRGVLTYSNRALKQGKITFDPKTTQAIIVCDKDGELAFIRGSQLTDRYNDKGSYDFDVTTISSATSVGELKAMLGLVN